jgi:CHAT domain-containing protein
MANPHSASQLSRIDSEIDELLATENLLKAENRARQHEVIQPRPISTLEVESLLDENTLLLEYVLGEQNCYLWALTNHSVTIYPLPSKNRIKRLATLFYRSISRNPHNRSRRSERTRVASGARLSQLILGPVENLLGSKRLIIISDGSLQYIPFAALPEPGAGKGATPLIAFHEIVNLPSAAVLVALRERERITAKPAHQLLILADPVFDINDQRLPMILRSRQSISPAVTGDISRTLSDSGTNWSDSSSLPRLIFSRREADAVNAAFGGEARNLEILDFDASRQTVLSGILNDYSMLHFATHGLLNNEHPELSGLVLSLIDKRGIRQNGFVNVTDVYGFRLRSDLVVLSGCKTGLGTDINGEGFVGLSRAFIYAGANRVVASLWNVSDSATSVLMEKFYRNMRGGILSPAAALRRAQIETSKSAEWNDPYYWAAFQLQGEWK